MLFRNTFDLFMKNESAKDIKANTSCESSYTFLKRGKNVIVCKCLLQTSQIQDKQLNAINII